MAGGHAVAASVIPVSRMSKPCDLQPLAKLGLNVSGLHEGGRDQSLRDLILSRMFKYIQVSYENLN